MMNAVSIHLVFFTKTLELDLLHVALEELISDIFFK